MFSMWRQRHSERGQVVPIAALMFVVLLGATAIAVDLSMQTNTRRALQNVSDSAALAGARDLPSASTQAVDDALTTVGTNLSLPSGWEGSNPVHGCPGGGQCADITYSTGGMTYAVKVNTPPQLTSNSSLKDKYHLEVVVKRTSGTFVAGALGFANATEGASSVAVNTGPNVPFGFALFSQTFETGGNQGETVAGNVYAGQYINPQSNGQADFCVGTDSNGDGTIFLGSPQYSGSGSPTNTEQYGQAPNGADPDTVHQITSCSSASGSSIVAQEASLGCPSSVSGISGYTFTYDVNYSKACVVSPAITPPGMDPPKTGPFYTFDGTGLGHNKTVLKITTSLLSGVYKIIHNTDCNPPNCYDVDFNGAAASGTYNVTFWLENGATIGVEKGANVTINPYIPSNPVGNDGRFIIYSDAPPATDAAGLYAVDSATVLTLGTVGSGSGGCTNSKTGTVYLPNGSVNDTSNARLAINGQAIVQSWNVQTGNHTNPSVTFDGCNLSAVQQVYQLVQ